MPIKKITCLAVDDEPPALGILKKYIETVPALELAATCKNAVEAWQVLQDKTIDLIFLDIQMPQLLGTDFLRTLKNPPKIIFTTAFRKYAIEGFDLDAVDYLLKPISFERFLKAINKLMNTNLYAHHVSLHIEKENVHQSFIHFRADRKTLKIPLDDILFIESLKNYIKVVTKTRPVITKQPIYSMEENLPKDFIRIHRSYIVAINKIESYTNDLIQIGKYEIPISRSYRHEVEKALHISKNKD